MVRKIALFLVAAVAPMLLASVVEAQQTGSGTGRKHHERKADTAKSTAPKADDKAYNAALKSLPNKPYDPWSGTR